MIFFSDASKVLTLGIVSVRWASWSVSAAVALATRNFRWEGFRDAEDTANHLIGAALMGVGGVTALGCTIGQGLSGLSTPVARQLRRAGGHPRLAAVPALRWQMCAG